MWGSLLKTLKLETIASASSLWGADPKSIVLVSQGINAVYRFESRAKTFYLRVTHEKLRKLVELEAALLFQQYLSNCDVPVCTLVKSTNNRLIEKVPQDNHVFLAHVVSEVPGTPMHFNYSDLALYEYWGKMLGELHKASVNYNIAELSYPGWEGEIDELQAYVKNEPQFMKDALLEVSQYMHQYPINQHNFGLIHGDHRKGNVLTDGKVVHFIDFDLPRFFWFMDDITRPFFSAIVQNHTNWQAKLAPYITGYRSVFALDEIEFENFVWFIRLKLLNMYLWTKNNWSDDTAPGGASTKAWLSLLYRAIENRSWESALNLVMHDVKNSY